MLVAGIGSRRSIRSQANVNKFCAAAAFLPGVFRTLMTQVVFQSTEQVAAEASTTGLGVAEIRRLEQASEKFMGQLPRGFGAAALMAQEGHHRLIIGLAQLTESLPASGAVSGRMAHKGPAGGVEGIGVHCWSGNGGYGFSGAK